MGGLSAVDELKIGKFDEHGPTALAVGVEDHAWVET